MIQTESVVRRNALRLTALAVICAIYPLAQLPRLPAAERAALASRFSFERSVLPDVPGQPHAQIRAVHPSYEAIAAWISSVGAAVALHDLDGDGLPNDVCYVQTSTDQVIVTPAPSTPARYAAFALSPEPLSYDRATMAPMGCLPGDLNEDGQADLLVYYWGRTPVAFLAQTQPASGAASLRAARYTPREIMPTVERWFSNAATLADLDGDGHVDLIVGNYFPDGARVLDASDHERQPMQDSMSRAYNGGSKRLLRWIGASAGAQPTVQFADQRGALDDEVDSSWTLAVAACDIDGDLRPELYFANDFGPDRLLHNLSEPGQLRFVRLVGQASLTTPSSKVVGHDSFKGMGVDCGDLNGDGRPDLFVSNITAEFALEESNFAFISTGDLQQIERGRAPYVDQSEPLGLSRSDGWAWDARLADFDNDGVLELIQATGFVQGAIPRWADLHELAMGNDLLLHDPRSWPNFQLGDDLSGHQHTPFFVRSASGRYYDLAADLGLGDPQVSRGIATADVDGDGALDYAVANQWQPSSFYHNQHPRQGQFLGLHLLLPIEEQSAPLTIRPGHPAATPAARPAIGATATLHLPDGRALTAQVDGGNGHSGKRSPDLLFGLADLPPATPLDLDLTWRDAHGQIHQQRTSLTAGWHTVLLGQ